MANINRSLRIQFCIAFSLAMLVTSSSSAGPYVHWVDQPNTPARDEVRSLATDGMGGVFVLGHTLGDLYGPVNPNDHKFLAKYGSSGPEWGRQYEHSNGQDLAWDGEGGLYDVGATLSPYNDAVITKSSGEGDLNWSLRFGVPEPGGFGTLDGANSVAIDVSGNVYMAGGTQGSLFAQNPNSRFDGFLRKLDSEGNEIWSRQFGTAEHEQAWAVAADGDGNAYVAGNTPGSFAAPNVGGSDVFLIKYNPSGSAYWSIQMAATHDNNYIADIAVDAEGSIYLAESRSFGLDGDATLRKLNTSGELLWTTELTGWSVIGEMDIDENGNVLLAGNNRGNNGVVGKFDMRGELRWEYEFQTPETDIATALSVDNSGNIFVGGHTWGNMRDPEAGRVIYSSSDSDAWIALMRENAPGDTNGDGAVDIVDLNNVRNHFGETGGLGDTNGDGLIDLEDLNAVRNNFGAGGSNSVPEPTALLLALMTSAGIVFSRIRHVLEPRLTLAALVGQSRRGGGAFAAQLSSTDRGRT